MKQKQARNQAHKEIDLVLKELFINQGMSVRNEQVSLAHQMLEAMFDNEIALCDAAVGVGKTYAYLIACIMMKKYGKYGRKIYATNWRDLSFVVSTSSITLQEALTTEYLPFLSSLLLEHKLLQEPLKVVVRKGKEHFVCDNRLKTRLKSVQNKEKNKVQREALYALQEIYDMDNVSGLSNFDKRQVCVPKFCPTKCSFKEECRYQKYLNNSLSDQIFLQICNHNYLLADSIHRASGYRPLLNEYQVLVLDEAHRLPEAAQQMYGASMSLDDFEELCCALEKEKITHISCILREQFQELGKIIGKRKIHMAQVRYEFYLTAERQRVLNACVRWLNRAAALTGSFTSRWLCNQLEEGASLLSQFLEPHPDMIHFLEYTPKGTPIFCIVNRRTEEILEKHLWRRETPVILTSGTLKAGMSFERTRQIMGLKHSNRVLEYTARSPFKYEKNCLLYFPRDRKQAVGKKNQMQRIIETIRKLVCATYGHTMVLFTSYSMMGIVYKSLREQLPFPVLKIRRNSQGILQEFKKKGNSVLFAAGACWEGVDFPGDMVSSLIIAQLPFPVPDPVREVERERYGTLQEYIKAEIVPDMQVKLRQGFGRAIRTEVDTCVVSILDERAAFGGRYHQAVLDALPVCPVTDKLMDVELFIRNCKTVEYYL